MNIGAVLKFLEILQKKIKFKDLVKSQEMVKNDMITASDIQRVYCQN